MTLIKKNDFPLPVSQLQIVSWLVPCPLHPPSVLGCILAWTCADPVHSVMVSVNLCVSGRYCFLVLIYHFFLLQYLHPLQHRLLSLERRALTKTSHLELSTLQSVTACTFSDCFSLCYFPSTARRRFFGVIWTKHWSMGIAVCP